MNESAEICDPVCGKLSDPLRPRSAPASGAAARRGARAWWWVLALALVGGALLALGLRR